MLKKEEEKERERKKKKNKQEQIRSHLRDEELGLQHTSFGGGYTTQLTT